MKNLNPLIEKINQSNLTNLSKRVLIEVGLIPKGSLMTYGQIAKKVGTGPRVVGNILNRNPFAPEVPCHRVIGVNNLYGYRYGKQKKIDLLKKEGVDLENARVLNYK